MAHVLLNAETEIKKEDKKKLPTITIATAAHGLDYPSIKFRKIDPNVRIYSPAGMTHCYGVSKKDKIKSIYDIYLTPERLSGEDNRTSYEMLQKVCEYNKTPEEDARIKRVLKREQNNANVDRTLEVIAKKKHNQIFTPHFDHEYLFEDEMLENEIAVIETKNHTSKSNINYKELPNLAEKRFNIHEESLEERSKLDLVSIFKLFKTFKLKSTSLDILDQYSKDIYENRHLLFEDGFFSLHKILTCFSDPHSKIYDYITSPEDKEIIEKTVNDFGIFDSDDEKIISQKREKFRNFYYQYNSYSFNDKINSIMLNELIKFLKSEGFEVINIIDNSCRSLGDGELKDEEDIRELEEEQFQNALLIDRGLGVTRKRRRRKRTKKRRKQTKKRRR